MVQPTTEVEVFGVDGLKKKVPDHNRVVRSTGLLYQLFSTGIVNGYKGYLDSPNSKYVWLTRGLAIDAGGSIIGNGSFTLPDPDDAVFMTATMRKIDVLAKGGFPVDYTGPAYVLVTGLVVEYQRKQEGMSIEVVADLANRSTMTINANTDESRIVNGSVLVMRLTVESGLVTKIDQTPGYVGKLGFNNLVDKELAKDLDDAVSDIKKNKVDISSLIDMSSGALDARVGILKLVDACCSVESYIIGLDEIDLAGLGSDFMVEVVGNRGSLPAVLSTLSTADLDIDFTETGGGVDYDTVASGTTLSIDAGRLKAVSAGGSGGTSLMYLDNFLTNPFEILWTPTDIGVIGFEHEADYSAATLGTVPGTMFGGQQFWCADATQANWPFGLEFWYTIVKSGSDYFMRPFQGAARTMGFIGCFDAADTLIGSTWNQAPSIDITAFIGAAMKIRIELGSFDTWVAAPERPGEYYTMVKMYINDKVVYQGRFYTASAGVMDKSLLVSEGIRYTDVNFGNKFVGNLFIDNVKLWTKATKTYAAAGEYISEDGAFSLIASANRLQVLNIEAMKTTGAAKAAGSGVQLKYSPDGTTFGDAFDVGALHDLSGYDAVSGTGPRVKAIITNDEAAGIGVAVNGEMFVLSKVV